MWVRNFDFKVPFAIKRESGVSPEESGRVRMSPEFGFSGTPCHYTRVRSESGASPEESRILIFRYLLHVKVSLGRAWRSPGESGVLVSRYLSPLNASPDRVRSESGRDSNSDFQIPRIALESGTSPEESRVVI